jgi:hypothetical protein
MHSLRQKRKSIAVLVIIALSTFSIISAPAHAAMVNTAEILKPNRKMAFLSTPQIFERILEMQICWSYHRFEKVQNPCAYH